MPSLAKVGLQFCGDPIQNAAVQCEHCGQLFDGRQSVQRHSQIILAEGKEGWVRITAIVFATVIVVIVLIIF